MANTIGTSTLSEVWRIKYAQKKLDLSLKTASVSEKCFKKDTSGAYYISNPYLTAQTATAATMAGTYTVTSATTTDDKLTVTDQVSRGVHLFEFEDTLSRADLFSSFVDDLAAETTLLVDQWVINYMANNAGETYETAAGGFTTPGNINKIIGDLLGKVAGYDPARKGFFLIIENTDVTGFIQAGMSNGFSFADAHLNNGWAGVYGGVDIYVVRTGVFSTSTIGTLSASNSGKRLFGVKDIHTYALPKGVQYQELKTTGKTGKEIGVWANVGAAVWTQKANLLVTITIG
jgi:hypothetical protein